MIQHAQNKALRIISFKQFMEPSEPLNNQVKISNLKGMFMKNQLFIKEWLTYSGGTDRPGKLCYNFLISNDLNQIVNFPTRIPDRDSHSPARLDLFFF